MRIGPDLMEKVTTLDEAGRVEPVVRQPQGGGELMRAHYDYYADGALHLVTYLNGAKTEYQYDDARRLTILPRSAPPTAGQRCIF